MCSTPSKNHISPATTSAALNVSAISSTTTSVKSGTATSAAAASQAQHASSISTLSSSIIPPTKPIAFAAVAKHNTSQPPAQTENGQYSAFATTAASSATVSSNASTHAVNQQQQPSVINALQSISNQHTPVSLSIVPTVPVEVSSTASTTTPNSTSGVSNSIQNVTNSIGNNQHNASSAGSASDHSTIFTSITNNLTTTSSSAIVATVNSSMANCLSPTNSVVSNRTSPGLMSPKQLSHATLNGPTTTPNAKQLTNATNATGTTNNNESMSSLKSIVQEVINRAAAGLDSNSLLVSSGTALPPTSISGAPTPSDTRQQPLFPTGTGGTATTDPSSQTNGPNSAATNHSATVVATAAAAAAAAASLSSNSLLKSNLLNAGTNEAHIPPLLGVAPLGPSPLQKEHQLQFQMMEAAYYHLPAPSDSERLRTYLQRQPIQTPAHYPQVCIAIDKINIEKNLMFFFFNHTDSAPTFRYS